MNTINQYKQWWAGFADTVKSVMLTPRPDDFHSLVLEETIAKDGESFAVWWPRKFAPVGGEGEAKSNEETTGSTAIKSRRLWIILPGGMNHGDSFYAHKAVAAGLFKDDEHWSIFHNPGIITKTRIKSPPGLTEVRYLEEYIALSRQRGYTDISIIGFSAGSMLAIAMAKRADVIDQNRLLSRHGGGDVEEAFQPYVGCVVGVHGPDKIRSVFEAMNKTYSRLDILFSLSLYNTMAKSGNNRGTDLIAKDGRAPWMRGWPWMKKFTEDVFETEWDDMEAELWSCSAAMEEKLNTPVLRIISKDDPIIAFDDIDQNLFANLDKVILQDGAGHTNCFIDKSVAPTIREWREGALERQSSRTC